MRKRQMSNYTAPGLDGREVFNVFSMRCVPASPPPPHTHCGVEIIPTKGFTS